MANRLLLTIFFAFGVSIHAFAASLTFDWNGSSTNWASSGSWNETGGTGDYPGSGSRTTDIVRFGVTGSSYSRMPVLTASLTVASIEFGGTIVSSGTKLTVNTNTLTVGSITQDMNTLNNSGTFDYLQGTGTITCTGNINVGAGTSSSGNNNYMLSDIATLNVLGNVNIVANVNLQNGSGFRLEAGNMYLSGIISFTTNSRVTASNACYFTINTITQATPQVATTPYLYFLNASPIGTIPTPYASVNLYGDHGGTGTVTYTAADPQITTTSTPGFGSGGANIDTSKASYDNLVIQATGIAKIGGSTVGALKVAGDFNTNSPVTFSPAGASATNTSVGGNWNNTSTVTGGVGSTAIIGNITNSGAMTLSSGILQVGGNVSNSSTIAAGTGSITIDGSLSNTNTLTLSSGALKVAGNYTNSATFTAGSGTVYFNGALAQSLADNSTSGTTFNNVDFSGGGTKTLSGTGSFAVSTIGVLTMQGSNILQTGGILTLNSASTGSATVAAIPSNSSITGNVNVQRYISGGSNSYRGYRFLSSAIYTVKSGSNYYYDLSYLPNFAPVTGSLASGGVTKTGNPTIYLYRDDEAFTNKTFNTGNFRGVNKINNNPLYQIGVDYDGTFALHAGTGFLFFYRGNLTNISTKYLSTTVAEANVFVSTGVLNQQAVTVTNWVTGLTTLQFSAVPGNTGYSGYNLVGNPYASSIDWNTLSATNASTGIYGPGVGTSTYIYNEVAKVYAIYNASVGSNGATNIIPTGQGFFVKATAAGAQLIFNEAAKTNAQLTGPTSSTGSTLLLSASPVTDNSVQYLRLNLAADTINKEETIIRFENGASDSYVENEDSSYLQSLGQVSLSSMSADNIQSGINTIPFPKKSKTIKLKANTTGSGLFSLNLTEIKNVPELFEVWLMDAYKKDSLDMRHNSTYKFNVSLSDTNSFGLNRFSLVIRQNKALGVHLLNFTALKAARGAQIAWKVENEQNYTTFTVERSVDNGITFNQLGTLTSGGTGDYSFMDTNPLLVADKYRLKLIDLNGTVTYSNVVTLMYGNVSKEAASNISVYPNPAKGALNLTIVPASNLSSNSDLSLSSVTPLSATVSANTVYNIKIINNTGSVIKTATTSQAGWQTDVGSLLPGTYFIQVTNSNNKTLVGKSTFIKL